MKVLTLVLCLALAGLFLIGCGGGGDTKPPGDTERITFKATDQGGSVKIADYEIFVPKAAFPNGATLTLTVNTPVNHPAAPCFQLIGAKAGLTIISSAMPADDISLKLPESSKRFRYGLWQQDKSGEWQSLAINQADNQPLLLVPKEVFFPNKEVQSVIGGLELTPISDKVWLESYYPEIKTYDAIYLVHGYNETYLSLKLWAAWLHQRFPEANIYGFCFDWRRDNRLSAAALKELIEKNSLEKELYNNMVFSHSQGGLVTRYMMERLGCKRVHTVVQLSTPNHGSFAGTALQLVRWLETAIVNGMALEAGSEPLVVPEIDNPAIGQLTSRNSFVEAELNTVPPEQRIGAAYHFVVGLEDTVVGKVGGMASDIPIELKTRSVVRRYCLPGISHNSIIHREDHAAKALEAVFPNRGTMCAFYLDPLQAEGSIDGWSDIYLHLVNDGQDEAKIIDLAVDQYDYYGNWFGTVWYDGSRRDFPFQDMPMEVSDLVSPGKTWTRKLHIYPDDQGHSMDQIPLERRARTLIFTIRYLEGGQINCWDMVLSLSYGNLRPKNPITRSKRPL